MFQRLVHDTGMRFAASFLALLLINAAINSDAKASSSLEFAEKIFRAGKNFNCRARGWFTGYSGETDVTFYGSYITVMPSPWRYDEKTDKISLEFEKVYHVIKVLRRGKHKFIGQLYSPGLASLGGDPLYGTVELKANYFGEITLIVSNEGRSKSTDFACQLDIDDMF